MKAKPILFSGPMVRALLEGRKTQTRRLLKRQQPPGFKLVGLYAPGLTAVFNPAGREHRGDPDKDVSVKLPYMPRDLLWVRETWAPWSNGEGLSGIDYRATRATDDRRWKPSIFMPRSASRLTLDVTNVRVERLQDISREDAMAEGIEPDQSGRFNTIAWSNYAYGNHPFNCAIASFRSLWNRINGAGAWDANPWVVALTFTVHKCNVDAMPQRVKEVA